MGISYVPILRPVMHIELGVCRASGEHKTTGELPLCICTAHGDITGQLCARCMHGERYKATVM